MKIYATFLEIMRELFERKLDYNNVMIDIQESNVKEIIDMAINHKVFNIVYQVLIRKFPSNRYLKLLNNQRKKYISNYNLIFKEIINRLTEEGIRHCVIKGQPLSYQLYGDQNVRECGDIDIVIEYEALDKAYFCTKKMGYFQEGHENSDYPIINNSDEYFEVKMILNKKVEYPSIELKIGSSAFGRKNIGWLDNTDYVDLGEIKVVTQSKTYALIHLFANTFLDNEDRIISSGNIIRNYFDLAYFLEYTSELDFSSIIEISEKIGSCRKLYNVLYSLKQIFVFKLFDIQKAISLVASKALNYPQRMPVFTEAEEFMGGSRVPNNIIRTSAKIRLLDKDMAFCEYVKNHKIAVFSKLNKLYLNKCLIKYNNSTVWKTYKYVEGVKYRYCNNERICIECAIDSKVNKELSDHFVVMLIIINSNCFSPVLYNECHISLTTETIHRRSLHIGFDTMAYSKTFIDENKGLFIIPTGQYSVYEEKEEMIYLFEIDKHSILLEHNDLLFEFRIARINNPTSFTSMHFSQEIIEFL